MAKNLFLGQNDILGLNIFIMLQANIILTLDLCDIPESWSTYQKSAFLQFLELEKCLFKNGQK